MRSSTILALLTAVMSAGALAAPIAEPAPGAAAEAIAEPEAVAQPDLAYGSRYPPMILICVS